MCSLDPTRLRNGFTVTELLFVIICVAALAAVLLPALKRARSGSRINCASNLKQVSLAFMTWAIDHNDRFPMEESNANGGTMELTGNGAISPTFQVMSNELSTPKILLCPEDRRRQAATNFSILTDASLSYFLNIDSSETNRNFLLSGDRNLTNKPAPSDRFVRITAVTSIGWARDIHSEKGHISLRDGSVAAYTNGSPVLATSIKTIGTATNRLALP